MSNLAYEIARIAQAHGGAGSGAGRLATVIDSRPGTFSVLIPGFTSAVEAIVSDLFDVMPIETGDTVLVFPVQGLWVVVARIMGDEAGATLDTSSIAQSLVTAGPGLMEEDDIEDVLLQVWRSPALSITAGGSFTVEWEFVRPYSDPPSVVATVETAGNAVAVLAPTTKLGVEVKVWNNGSAPLSGVHVVAQAHGIA